jgi:hypothetical protein
MFTRDVAAGVHRIENAFTNWYIIEADDGLTIVDAGVPSSWESLARLGRPIGDVRAESAAATAAPARMRGDTPRVRGVVFPGAFHPRSDTWLLARAGCRERLALGARILELCAGPAFAGITVARSSGAHLTTVDVSRRAVVNAATKSVTTHRVEGLVQDQQT